MAHHPGRMEKWAKTFKGYGVEPIFTFPPVAFILMFVMWTRDAQMWSSTLSALGIMLPFWLPFALLRYFWPLWIDYIRFLFKIKNPSVLLEIILPPEVPKSPLAMEVFITGIWSTARETTFVNRIWQGRYRPMYSLEIASNEGRIGFYIHVEQSSRSMVEARLYGQFPEARIVEVPDYALAVPFNTDEWDIVATEMRFEQVSVPSYPIKTYVDFGLDKDPDEELKVDPLTNILDLFGSLQKNEYFWMQIIIRGLKGSGEEWYGFYMSKEHSRLYVGMKEEIQKIIKGAIDRAKETAGHDAERQKKVEEQAAGRGLTLLTEGERNRIKVMERKMSKVLFEAGIRVIYMAKKESFRGGNAAQVIRFFESFRSEEYNAIRAGRGMNDFDYPWQDFMDIRHNIEKRRQFTRYHERAYFMVPYDQRGRLMVFNPEELATLWHFPGTVFKTPGLKRVTSTVAEPPSNLPTLPS